MLIIYDQKETVATESGPRVIGWAPWVATYKYECALEDIRMIDIQEQQRRDVALGQRIQKSNRAQGSGKVAVPGPDSLFNLLLLQKSDRA